MAYACYDGYGEVGHILGQCQRVEPRHVGRSTTAADDDDAVEGLRVVCPYSVKCTDDALLHLFTLHHGGE